MAVRRATAAACVGLLALVASAASGEARERTLAGITVAGSPQVVFDWSSDACDPLDIPDLPARAFRDAEGNVQLLASHYENRRMVGPDLDRVRRDCTVVLRSSADPRPSAFDGRKWLAAPYTLDGTTVFALVHNEYQGHEHPGRCPSRRYRECWYNSVTFAASRNGGRSYEDGPAARKRVATLPFRYVPETGPSGIFAPSNIVRASDGYFYAFVFQNRGDKPERWRGSCLMRTRTLGEPQSWRAWNGRSFAMRFVDPYRERGYRPTRHLCRPLTPDLVEGLAYSTVFGRYIRVGTAVRWDAARRDVVGSVYYSLSRDLVHWTPQQPIFEAEFTYTHRCGDPPPIAYPSLIDPASPTRNLETVGETAFVYFTQFKVQYHRLGRRHCTFSLDRDLVRVPVEFSLG